MSGGFDLVCFDMDGVLTKVRSSWAWIHNVLGVDDEEAYWAYINQEIDEKEFMRRDIAIWKGVKPDINERDLVRWFRTMPLTGGIQETVAALQEGGAKCVIVSGGIDLAARMLAGEYGFDDVAADHIETDAEGYLTGEGVEVVDLKDKGKTVRMFMERYGAPKERTASIGNSFTDIPMFECSGTSVAFNPSDPYTEEAATYVVRSENISDVLEHLLPEEKCRPP